MYCDFNMISWPIVLYTVHQYILQLLGAPVSQKKLQESKAEEKPDTLKNPMALFFSSRIFVVKGQPPENYLNQQRCQQFGRVLSYLPTWANSNDLHMFRIFFTLSIQFQN